MAFGTGFWNTYPGTDLHEIDLHYVLMQLLQLRKDMQQVVDSQAITFADPINWNITSQYPTNQVVLDSNGDGYISRQPVPAGIPLSNSNYWTQIFSFNDIADRIRASIAVNAGTSATTPQALAVNDLVWWQGDIYRAMVAMPAGTAFIEGTNVERYTVDEKFSLYNGIIENISNALTAEVQDREAADTELSTNISNLETDLEEEIQTRESEDSRLEELIQQAAASGSIVSVSDYGARGDGVTDDTNAINTCLSSNPNAVIIFNKGNYRITDTLHIYGNQGGQTVIFGGATITFDGSADPARPMVAIDEVTDTESRAHIIGGTFMGSDKASVGIFSNMFHSTISDCKVYDCTRAGYVIGTSEGGRSLQNVVENCMVSVTRDSSMNWSDGNVIKGIELLEPDGVILNFNSNRTNVGAYIESSGYEFIGCHFTAQYRAPLAAAADTRAVEVNPIAETTKNVNKFTNCYFDNHKFVIYGVKQNWLTIVLVNCHYFNSGKQTTGVIDCFMLGGYNTYLQVDDFTIVPANTKCRFFDANWTQNASYSSAGQLRQQYKHTIYSLADEARVPYTAAHYTPSGEPVYTLNAQTVEAGTMRELGALVMFLTKSQASLMPTVKLTYIDRNAGYVEVYLRAVSGGALSVLQKNVIHTAGSGPQLLIGNGDVVTLNGKTAVVYPICFRNTSGTVSVHRISLIADYSAPAAFYANNDSATVIDSYNESDYLVVPLTT